MLTAEPTSGVVWNANRGAISLLVTVKGRAAHVGLQHLGVNAFERMTAVAGLLAELKNDVESRRTGYALAPDAARSSILLIGGRSEGGTNFNVVPEECRFTVDRRMNPEEDFETEKQRLLQTFDEARRRGIDVEVQTIQEGEPAGSPTDSPLAEALRGAIEAVAGITPSFEMCPGLLETRFYARRGVPAFAYGPGLLSVAHGPKEFVKLESILECAAVYALTAARVVSSR
jgi:acetylornithine deacetylase/succinyl-diaminopimelate desuccinylase-like protein